MGLFDDEYKKLMAQLTGHSFLNSYLEEQQGWRAVLDDYSTSSLAKLAHERQSIEDLFGHSAALGVTYRADLERAYRDLVQPWNKTCADIERETSRQREITDAIRQRSELDPSIASAKGTLTDFWRKQQEAVEQLSGLHRFPTVLYEFERLRETLERPEWQKIIDELARGDLSFGELVDEAAQAAEEHGLVEKPAVGHEPAPWYRNRDTLIGIAGIILALLAWLRSEMIAASSDKQLEELGVQLQETLKAQAIVINEIRHELRREQRKRWQVLVRGATLRIDPAAGSSKLRNLDPGEIATEIDDHGKWILVEVEEDGHVVAGWVLKKRLRRFRDK